MLNLMLAFITASIHQPVPARAVETSSFTRARKLILRTIPGIKQSDLDADAPAIEAAFACIADRAEMLEVKANEKTGNRPEVSFSRTEMEDLLPAIWYQMRTSPGAAKSPITPQRIKAFADGTEILYVDSQGRDAQAWVDGYPIRPTISKTLAATGLRRVKVSNGVRTLENATDVVVKKNQICVVTFDFKTGKSKVSYK